jgi:hypothetical protein
VARGNNFTLIVELQQLVISDEGRETTTQIEGTVTNVNICPSNAEPVAWNDWQMAQTSNGAAVAISIPSTQPLGAYGIEITGTRTGGGAFRWYAKPGEGFIIVDASSDNFLTDMVRIYTITGIVGVGSSSSGDGGGATGTLNTSNSTAQTPQSGESFGGNINLHKVSKTGSYNDLTDKPVIPTTLSKLSEDTTHRTVSDTEKTTWNNKQDTLVSGTNIKTINNESVLGDGNINIDISGKEDVTSIVTPVNETDATLPITALTTEVGKYYRIDVPVDTLSVTLPAMTDLTTVRTVVIYLTAGTTPSITISSSDNKDVYYQDGYEIEAGKTYEVSCLYNGAAWVVGALTINTGE